MAYLDKGWSGGDPTVFPRAEEAVRRSLALHPKENGEAPVARGAGHAAHHFAAARADALAAIRVSNHHADAYAVLTYVETQLGHVPAATAAVQRLLDLLLGLPAYARAAYDLEQRGRTAQAADLMRRALDLDQPGGRGVLPGPARRPGLPRRRLRRRRRGVRRRPGRRPDGGTPARPGPGGRGPGLHGQGAGHADLTSRVPYGYLLEYAELLRAAGRPAQADERLSLAVAAHRVFTANGGTDGITGAALAAAAGRPADAVREARAEWARRQHADVADAMAWSLHLAGKDARRCRTAIR